jgi:hypothetical protein
MRPLVVLGAAMTASMLLAGCGGSSSSLPGTINVPPNMPAAATNAIKNGCFSGTTPWKYVKGVGRDTGNPASGVVKIVKGGYGSCKGSAFMGTTKNPAPNGFWGVSQTLKVTPAGKLSWWFWGASTDSLKYGDQEVDVVMNGKIVYTCYKQLITNPKTAWKLGTCSLKKYAGKTVSIQFGVYDNGYSKTYDYWYVSDVSLT